MSDTAIKVLRVLGLHDEADILVGFYMQREKVQWTADELRKQAELEKNLAAAMAADKIAHGGDTGSVSAQLRDDGPKVTMGQERVPPVNLGTFDFRGLQMAVDARARHIDPNGLLGSLFFATELGGEIGEALNVVKKLERERMGIDGRRDNTDHLAQELSDGIITCCNVARQYGIDLHSAIVTTFNRTSAERDLPVMLK